MQKQYKIHVILEEIDEERGEADELSSFLVFEGTDEDEAWDKFNQLDLDHSIIGKL